MVNFLTRKEEMNFRRFANTDLAYKYDMYIGVDEEQIVIGNAPNEKIVDALKVRFFIKDSKEEFIENKIKTDIHRYCYENNLNLDCVYAIEKDVWNGEIRYGLIYIEGDKNV